MCSPGVAWSTPKGAGNTRAHVQGAEPRGGAEPPGRGRPLGFPQARRAQRRAGCREPELCGNGARE